MGGEEASVSYGATAAPGGRATEPDNRCVWDGARRGHYEVWYLTCNHLASGAGLWIRYTLEAPGEGIGRPYAVLWFALFDPRDPARGFAIHQRFPIDRLSRRDDPFAIGVGDSLLEHDRDRGALAGDGHTARWDVSWLPQPRTLRQLPDLIYRTSFADTRVLSPNVDVPLRGTVSVDGRELVFDGDPGGQTHLWGRKHAHAWAWAHCNAFQGRRGVVLEALSARLKRRGLVLPPLTVVTLWLDGEELRLNGLHHAIRSHGRFGTARYAFDARGREARLEGELTCRPEDMVLAPYEDPDGEPAFCANSCVADLRMTVWRRSGWLGRWREQATLTADKTAHFEVAGRQPEPAIRRRHVALGEVSE
jgi:hypothetical protein